MGLWFDLEGSLQSRREPGSGTFAIYDNMPGCAAAVEHFVDAMMRCEAPKGQWLRRPNLELRLTVCFIRNDSDGHTFWCRVPVHFGGIVAEISCSPEIDGNEACGQSTAVAIR
jgi:hypothetical protein